MTFAFGFLFGKNYPVYENRRQVTRLCSTSAIGGAVDMSDTLIIFGADVFSHGATEISPLPGVAAVPTSHRAFSDSAFAGGA